MGTNLSWARSRCNWIWLESGSGQSLTGSHNKGVLSQHTWHQIGSVNSKFPEMCQGYINWKKLFRGEKKNKCDSCRTKFKTKHNKVLYMPKLYTVHDMPHYNNPTSSILEHQILNGWDLHAKYDIPVAVVSSWSPVRDQAKFTVESKAIMYSKIQQLLQRLHEKYFP